MKLSWLFPIGLVLTTACPASESGTGGTDGSSGSTTDDPATTDATVSVTGATQGSMSNTGATMTSTMTDPVTTDMPTTTEDPTDTADSSGTTTDDPTSTTEPETSSTGPGESSSSSGEPVTPTYGPCDLEVKDPDMQCLEKGESCALIPSMNPNDPDLHWCSIPCEMGDPSGCPEPTSGDATVECSGLPGAPCALSCANGETCPDGMVCFDAMINNVMRCVWET